MAVVVGGGAGRARHGRADLRVVVAFLLGIFLGRYLEGPSCVQLLHPKPLPDGGSSQTTAIGSGSTTIRSSIQDLEDVPISNTSHHDDLGKPITKQQLLAPFVVPNVAGISVATILPGQRVEMHSHETMHEFFYVLEGGATFYVTGDTNNDGGGRPVHQGSFAHFAPPDLHGITVTQNNRNAVPLKLLLFGVTVDNR